MSKKLAYAPTIGDYHILADILMERCLGYETMLCPPMTKRTLETGAQHSPDMICTPFKITLGNHIEALEQGANVLIMPGAGCRLGFYDILQEQILKDLGYDFDMLSLFDFIPNADRLYTSLKKRNPELSREHFDKVLEVVVRICIDMDSLAEHLRRNKAFEVSKGEFDQNYKAYLREVAHAQTSDEAAALADRCWESFEAIEIDKPKNPIRIGIVGEIYVVVEPFSNCHMEDWLADNQVHIERPFDLTRMAIAINTVPDQIERSDDYVNYNIGSTANDAVVQAYEMMKDGVDGIIHVKPSSCSPEITAMSILQNMSRDLDVPVMYLTFDTETGEAGVHTRLEAFHDMIVMKRGK
jgi:predicted nucleotide-binding protein (sugar kinase/HSP70/actin superfamily)